MPPTEVEPVPVAMTLSLLPAEPQSKVAEVPVANVSDGQVSVATAGEPPGEKKPVADELLKAIALTNMPDGKNEPEDTVMPPSKVLFAPLIVNAPALSFVRLAPAPVRLPAMPTL